MSDLKTEEKEIQDAITDMKASIAQMEEDIETKHLDREQTEKEKRALERYLEKIKPGCDFIDENIDARKESRKGETDALKEAIKLLENTPAFKEAAAEDEKQALGECAVKCSNR